MGWDSDNLRPTKAESIKRSAMAGPVGQWRRFGANKAECRRIRWSARGGVRPLELRIRLPDVQSCQRIGVSSLEMMNPYDDQG
jgi:hypothetical protein